MDIIYDSENSLFSDVKEELKHFYIPYRKNLKLPSNLTFGLEIEFKMKNYDDNYKLNYVDEDNAAFDFLKEKGYCYSYDVFDEINNHIELVSPVLTDNKDTWIELDKILTFIKNNNGSVGLNINDFNFVTCGAHVHVGKGIFNDNPNGWLNFFKLWFVFENHIFKFTNGEYYDLRNNAKSKACKIDNICKIILNDYRIFNKIDISYLINNKLNCINFYAPLISDFSVNKINNPSDNEKSNTIEFRNPNGTLNKIIWQNNVNFFAKMFISCASTNFDNEKLDYLYNNKTYATEFDLCNLVFKDDFDKNCFLRQYYKDFSKKHNGISSRFWQ